MKADEDDFIPITLTRTGQAPLKFKGIELAKSDGSKTRGKDETRWHELTIYRTTGGKYVVRIDYETRWQGELSSHVAEVVADAPAAIACLREYDPRQPVQGYPPHETYEAKQKRLLEDVLRRYDAQVSEILASDEFAEVVD